MAKEHRKEEQIDIFTLMPSQPALQQEPAEPPSPKKKTAPPTAAVESMSIFDINPETSPDTVKKLEGWIGRLDVLIEDLGKKQSGQYSPELESMKSIRDGMHTTATTGRDLVDIPPDDNVEKYITRLERKIEKMPSVEEKAALDKKIFDMCEAKRIRLQTEGSYAKPFTQELALKMLGLDENQVKGMAYAESQGFPVVKTIADEMERTRLEMNALGVFDVSQAHKISHTGISMGSVTGSFCRYLSDKYSEVKDSKRGNYMQRIARTANFEIEHFGFTRNTEFNDVFRKEGSHAPDNAGSISIPKEDLASRINNVDMVLTPTETTERRGPSMSA